MVTKNYRFADVTFTLQMQYPYLEKQCREYEVEEEGIRIAVSEEEIERENLPDVKSSKGMLESLAVYRKISEIMVEHDTFLFHCSAVAVDGRAYLFTAPSGTGKSTHTRLWREVFGERAVMVNDDKPLLQVRRMRFMSAAHHGTANITWTPTGRCRSGGSVFWNVAQRTISKKSLWQMHFHFSTVRHIVRQTGTRC